jgi:thioredoxin reductase (NADPH)
MKSLETGLCLLFSILHLPPGCSDSDVRAIGSRTWNEAVDVSRRSEPGARPALHRRARGRAPDPPSSLTATADVTLVGAVRRRNQPDDRPPALIRARVGASGTAIQLDHDRLLALVQTDAELSQILLRAFILRRVELIARGYGDVIVIGSTHCAGTLRIKEFLVRNGHPHVYIDLDRERDAQELLDRFHVSSADIPVLICRGKDVLRNPSNQQIADCLGFNPTIDRSHVLDLVVVGAGPAGLAAAAGLEDSTLVLGERPAARQERAGESKTTWAFRRSGAELTGRAQAQALNLARRFWWAPLRSSCGSAAYVCEIDAARCRAPCPLRNSVSSAFGQDLTQFEGAGVYAATPMEAQLCADEDHRGGGGNRQGRPPCSSRRRAGVHARSRRRTG